jgi:threonine dehydratase
MSGALPRIADIRAAQARIAPYVHRTPVLTCRAVDDAVGARLFFKCENFQKIGAFKARGATNAVFSLAADVAARGVLTHSNHGAHSRMPHARGHSGVGGNAETVESETTTCAGWER